MSRRAAMPFGKKTPQQKIEHAHPVFHFLPEAVFAVGIFLLDLIGDFPDTVDVEGKGGVHPQGGQEHAGHDGHEYFGGRNIPAQISPAPCVLHQPIHDAGMAVAFLQNFRNNRFVRVGIADEIAQGQPALYGVAQADAHSPAQAVQRCIGSARAFFHLAGEVLVAPHGQSCPCFQSSSSASGGLPRLWRRQRARKAPVLP